MKRFHRHHRKDADREDKADIQTRTEVTQSVHRLETLTDRLEATTSALEDLLIRLREEEEANRQ